MDWTPQAPRRPPLAAEPAPGTVAANRSCHRRALLGPGSPAPCPNPTCTQCAPALPTEADCRQAASRIDTLERGVDFLRAALAQAQASRDLWRARAGRWQRLAGLLATERRAPGDRLHALNACRAKAEPELLQLVAEREALAQQFGAQADDLRRARQELAQARALNADLVGETTRLRGQLNACQFGRGLKT